MGILIDEATVSNIQAPDSQTLTVGLTVFPSSDSSSRAIASFGSGEAGTFYSKSVYQLVNTATATINPDTTIIGVNFDGPVVLTLPETTSNLNEISIMDEGGFCSPTNTITASSPGSLGSLVLSSAYSNIRTRNNGSVWIGETIVTVATPPFVGEEGSTTVVSEDGSTTSTSADGNTTFTVSPDGTTELAVQDGNTTTSTKILPDGTQIEAESNSNGNSSSFTTTSPDGTTIAQVDENNGATSTFTTSPDGTTTDTQVSSSGNSVNVVTSPDGTINTEISSSNGSTETSVVNPDGSSSSFTTASNGRITIITTSTTGVEVESVYLPWKSTYTVTTTPPGTTTTESPNPYQV